MAKNRDPGAGASYQVGSTAGPPLSSVMCDEGGLDLDLARKLAAAGGAPGQRDPAAMPLAPEGSGSADWPSGQTWAAPAGAG